MSKKSEDGKSISARIIGNWGDPGLSETGLYDFLSRFLIVQIIENEKGNAKIACELNWHKTIAVVLRPPPLWIYAYPYGRKNRSDASGVVNVQKNQANNYAEGAKYEFNNIQPITPAYKLGDIINIKKLEYPLYKDIPGFRDNCFYSNIDVDIFHSFDDSALISVMLTGVPSATNQGVQTSVLPSSDNYKLSGNFAPVAPATTFALDLCVCKTNLTGPTQRTRPAVAATSTTAAIAANLGARCYMRYQGGEVYIKTLTRLLEGPAQLPAQKKYDIKNIPGVGPTTEAALNNMAIIRSFGGVMKAKNIAYVAYVDVNSSGRTRPLDGGCVPNVIVSPSTFPTADRRNLGSVLIKLD